MQGSSIVAVVALVLVLFASIAANVFFAVERESTRGQLDEARRFGYLPVTDRPGCGWVKVPRCERCGRFHAPPAFVLPGPGFDPAPIEVFPTPAPREVIPDIDPAKFTPDDDAGDRCGPIFDGALSDESETLIANR